MCCLDFLEADDEFGLAPRIAVGVILQRQCAEGLADLVLGGSGRHLEVGIVVSRGISLDHGCGGGRLVERGRRG